MESKDLRIGNLIFAEDKIVGVDYLNRFSIGWGEGNFAPNKFDFFNPIPLNEEWLLKFGFEKKIMYSWKGNGLDYQPETSKTECQDYVLNNNFIARYYSWSYRKTENDEWITDISFQLYKHEWYEKCFENDICFNECKYVHQLQNLYYAIMGVELNCA
jgi:hypothetical protein